MIKRIGVENETKLDSSQEKIDHYRVNITLAEDVYQTYTNWKNALISSASTVGGAVLTGGPFAAAEYFKFIDLPQGTGTLGVLALLMLAGAGLGYVLADKRALDGAVNQVAEAKHLPRVQVREIFKNYALKTFPPELS